MAEWKRVAETSQLDFNCSRTKYGREKRETTSSLGELNNGNGVRLFASSSSPPREIESDELLTASGFNCHLDKGNGCVV